MKINIPVKELQLKSMKGKISKISSLSHYHFSLRKEHRNKTDFLRSFKMGNVDILSPFVSRSEYLAPLVNVIIRVLFYGCCNAAMQNLCRLVY